MGMIKMVKIRGFIAGVVAIILVILLAAFAAVAFGKRIPILSAITDFFGF